MADLTVAGHPNIFVIGDTARVMQNGELLPGLSPVAMQEGRYVAQVIADRAHGIGHCRPFRYFAVADIGPMHFSGLLAWLTWIAVHLFFLIGFRNRHIVLIQYAWAYVTFRPGAQIILPEDNTVDGGTRYGANT